MGGRESIEIGEVLRDIRCLATFVAVHGCHGVVQWVTMLTKQGTGDVEKSSGGSGERGSGSEGG